MHEPLALPHVSANPLAVGETIEPRRHIGICIAIFSRLSSGYRQAVCVRFWEGSVWSSQPALPPKFCLVLNGPSAVRRMFLSSSELSLSNAYIHGHFDIEGDFGAVMAFADHLLSSRPRLRTRLWIAAQLLRLPRPKPNPDRRRRRPGRLHSQDRDKSAIAHHYDLPPAFFSCFLDDRMVYSCAYFKNPNSSIATAQQDKLDYICRKLQLQPGQRLLDIGCGWGALIIHAVQHFGVQAVGITLSKSQAEFASQRVAALGLSGRARIEFTDYRELRQENAFDRVVSVGMFEHVGRAMSPVYFAQALRLLRPGGLFLNHAIAYPAPKPPGPKKTFFNQYIFPDGELLPLSFTLSSAEAAGFEVHDIENLRPHYALTLMHWLARLDASHARIAGITSEETFRVWRLYLAAARHQFEVGKAVIYQTLLSKPRQGKAAVPLTRDALYT